VVIKQTGYEMKKLIYLILLVFLIPASLFGQLEGTGTYADPYYGTLNGPFTLSGVKYVDYIEVDDETFTINAGATIVLKNTTSYILVYGTGIIDANGTSINGILFTADNDGDGNYGETGETWMSIAFSGVTDNGSTFDYCTFANAKENEGAPVTIAYSSGITFTSCTFRNNSTDLLSDAGCIRLLESTSVTIDKCLFYSNSCSSINIFDAASAATITESLFYSNSYYSVYTLGDPFISKSKFYTNNRLALKIDGGNPIVENCLFYKNAGNSTEPGGVVLDHSVSKFVNCTFAENKSISSSAPTAGAQIKTGDLGSYFINTLFWSNKKSFILDDFVGNATFSNCAATELKSGLILLSQTNNASTGPNFINPTSNNYLISVLSPCRDAGTDTHAQATIPSDDIDGHSRVSPTDIGAYEAQYKKWIGGTSTDWSTPGNWLYSSIPSSNDDVLISADGTNDPSTNTTFTVTNLQIAPGAVLTIGATDNVTISNTIKNDAGTSGLVIKSTAAGTGSLIHSSSSVPATVELYLATGGTIPSNYAWHDVSPPVTGATPSVFSGLTNNILYFRETDVTGTSLNDGYCWFDGGDYSGVSGAGFSSLAVGSGYSVYDNTDNTYSFTGYLNAANVDINLTATNSDPALAGYNLIGNPYPCSIDWSVVIPGLDASISKAIHFSENNSQKSWVSGVGNPYGVTSFIPPMQGFFVKTSAAATINLTSAAKTHTTHNRYKKGDSVNPITGDEKGGAVIPLIRFKVEDGIGTDETVVRFDNDAFISFDNNFDALKIIPNDALLNIWSTVENQNFSINGVPFPDPSTIIPLTINAPANGNYKITAFAIEGLDSYSLILEDKLLQVQINLKDISEYSFSAEAGKLTGRFVFRVANMSTGIEVPSVPDRPFNIYTSFGNLNITTLADIWSGKKGEVKIYDLTGKVVRQFSNLEFSIGETKQFAINEMRGIYMVEITSGMKRFVGKVSVIR